MSAAPNKLGRQLATTIPGAGQADPLAEVAERLRAALERDDRLLADVNALVAGIVGLREWVMHEYEVRTGSWGEHKRTRHVGLCRE
jgi:deoxyribodipyrimidine photolyase-like uncharacterized protein